MRSITFKSYNKIYKKNLFLVLLLYYSIFTSNFITDIRINYIVGFSVILVTLAALLYINNSISVNIYTAASLGVGVLSLLIGFSNQWIFRDIIADSLRYVAPLVGFWLGVEYFKKNNNSYVLNFIYLICVVEYILFAKSLIEYVVHIANTNVYVKYNMPGIHVKPLIAVFFIMGLKYNIFKKYKILVIIYIISFVVTPFLTLSKAGVVTTVTVLMLIIYNNFSKKKFIALILIMLVLLVYFNDKGIIIRLENSIKSLNPQNYNVDYSTSYRVIEILNVSHNIINNLPSLLLGFGAGAQWAFSYIEYKGGVEKQVFRGETGKKVHHIFFMYLGYVFRYGILGLFIILFWLYKVNYKIYKLNYVLDDNILISFTKATIYCTIYYSIWDAIVPVNIFGNPIFGLYLGIAVTVINSQIKNNRLII